MDELPRLAMPIHANRGQPSVGARDWTTCTESRTAAVTAAATATLAGSPTRACFGTNRMVAMESTPNAIFLCHAI